MARGHDWDSLNAIDSLICAVAAQLDEPEEPLSAEERLQAYDILLGDIADRRRALLARHPQLAARTR